MWKKLVTTARFAFCQRFTNYSHNHVYRFYNRLNLAQSEDQGGFRRSYQTMDHLTTYRLLEQKCREWSIKMWVATVDFMKAFDSVSRQSLWKALEKLRYRITLDQILEEAFRGTERDSLNGQRKRYVWDKKGERNTCMFCTFYSSTRCAKWHWKMMWNAGKNHKAWAYALVILSLIASQTCVLLTTFSCSQHRWSSSKKWCATSSRVLRV